MAEDQSLLRFGPEGPENDVDVSNVNCFNSLNNVVFLFGGAFWGDGNFEFANSKGFDFKVLGIKILTDSKTMPHLPLYKVEKRLQQLVYIHINLQSIMYHSRQDHKA